MVARFPVATALLSIALAAGLGGVGGAKMELITDQDKLLSPELDYHRRYMDFLDRFGDLEFLYVLIEGPDKQDMTDFADALYDRLSQSEDVRSIVYKFPTAWMPDYALHYAPIEDLQKLESKLAANRDEIKTLYDYANIDIVLDAIADGVNDTEISSSTTASSSKDLDAIIQALNGTFKDPFEPFKQLEAELNHALPGDAEYLWSDTGNSLLLLVMPSKDFSTLSVIEKPLMRIRADIQLTELDFNGRVSAGLTGRPALQADEMATTNQDMINASLFALVGVAVLFIFFFREIARPTLTMMTLIMAMGWTYGFVALTLGHLNLLSTVFALVLIGLGVDFGIHYLHRYQEELGSTGDPKEAALFSMQHAGAGIITGALTSSIAFFLALFTDFLGLAELGYVAGVGILFCLIGMLVTLPALLIAYDSRARSAHIPTPVHLLGLRHAARHPRTLIVILVALSVYLAPKSMEVRFDDNLLELQADNLESVEYEHKLMDESEYSTWYCAFQEPDMEAVRETVALLEADPTVAGMESLVDVLPKTPGQTQPLLNSIQSNLTEAASDEQAPYTPNIYVAQRLRNSISSLLLNIERMKQQAQQAAQGGTSAQAPQLTDEQMAMMTPEQLAQFKQMQAVEAPRFEISEDEQARLDQLGDLADALSGDDDQLKTKLASANALLFENARSSLKQVAQWASAPAPTPETLPEEFKMLYVGNDGSLLVMAYPKENIWSTEHMKEFVGAMRAIDPMVTGAPIQVYESSILMRHAFTQIGLLSLVAVAVMVFLDFFSLVALFFVVGPLMLGVFWMMCIMGQFDLHLNLANFFAIPILIGVGVDNAVHFYHRFEETRDVETTMYTTGTTLTLTALTTSVGFGSLIFASHKGLASFGALMALGTATCWFSCVIVMPAMIKVFGMSRDHHRYSIDSAG